MGHEILTEEYLRKASGQHSLCVMANLRKAAEESNNFFDPHIQDLLFERKVLNIKNLSRAALLLGLDLEISFERKEKANAE